MAQSTAMIGERRHTQSQRADGKRVSSSHRLEEGGSGSDAAPAAHLQRLEPSCDEPLEHTHSDNHRCLQRKSQHAGARTKQREKER